MPTIAQNERFNEKTSFISERLQTCHYRFYKLLQTRRKQVPRLTNSSEETRNDVRDKVVKSCDEYVNCLRSSHRGGDLPDYLIGAADKFKHAAYTKLAPQYILQDLGHELATSIFDANYKP